MTRSIWLIVLVVLSAAVQAQQQEGFSYTFLEASYTRTDFDNFSAEGDGLGISLSVELGEAFHVFGGYTGANLDSNVDTNGWIAGVGLSVPVTPLMDIVGRASYRTSEVDVPFIGTVENDGLGLGVGARVGANEWIEIYGGLTYIDLDSGNETVFDAGFLLKINRAFAVGVGGEWDDDRSAWRLDARLYFD